MPRPQSAASRPAKPAPSPSSARKRPTRCPDLTVEDFRYPEGLGIALPALVLGIRVAEWEFERPEMQRAYDFRPGRVWHRLAHQTGGLACHQHRFHATVLTPARPEVAAAMLALAQKWYGSNVGVGGAPLDDVLKYRADLKALFGPGVDCNHSYRDMEEGLYAIDVSPEVLGCLAADRLGASLDELINWPSGWSRAMGCLNRWKLAIIARNSD